MNKIFFNYWFSLIAIFLSFVITGCDGSNDEPDIVNKEDAGLQKIILGSSALSQIEGETRAASNGKKTTFEVGDKIGITIWEPMPPHGNKHFITENAAFVCTKVYANGTSEWSGRAKTSSDYGNVTLNYTVYWPYNERYSHSSCFTTDDIRNNGLPDIPSDQSTSSKYQQALFCMTGGSIATGSQSLSATLKHERSCYGFQLIAYKRDTEQLDDYENITSYIYDIYVQRRDEDTRIKPFLMDNGYYRVVYPGGDKKNEIKPMNIVFKIKGNRYVPDGTYTIPASQYFGYMYTYKGYYIQYTFFYNGD